MPEMGDGLNPMDDLVAEIRAEIAAFKAIADEDGLLLDGKPHPLLTEIRAREALLAKIFKDSN